MRVIGHGAFGKHQSKFSLTRFNLGYVFEAFDKNLQCKVALKRTQKAGNIVSREYEVLSLLSECPNVVNLLDFFYSVDKKHRIIQNTVMEFCQCSLEDRIKMASDSRKSMPFVEIKHFSRQLFRGLL